MVISEKVINIANEKSKVFSKLLPQLLNYTRRKSGDDMMKKGMKFCKERKCYFLRLGSGYLSISENRIDRYNPNDLGVDGRDPSVVCASAGGSLLLILGKTPFTKYPEIDFASQIGKNRMRPISQTCVFQIIKKWYATCQPLN